MTARIRHEAPSMRAMLAVLTLGILIGMLLSIPSPAQASTEDASRAYILASVGDAYVDVEGLTAAQVEAAATQARTDLGAAAFGDIDGVDLNGDGDVDERDERIADYIVIAQAAGVVQGFEDGTFGPTDNLRRAPTASIYAGVFGIGVAEATDDVQYVDVTKPSTSPPGNIHGCNIDTLSDLDDDGHYVAASLGSPTPGEPFIIQGYEPRTGEDHPDLFGPWDNVTEAQVDRMTDRAVDVAGYDQDYDNNCGESEQTDSLLAPRV